MEKEFKIRLGGLIVLLLLVVVGLLFRSCWLVKAEIPDAKGIQLIYPFFFLMTEQYKSGCSCLLQIWLFFKYTMIITVI